MKQQIPLINPWLDQRTHSGKMPFDWTFSLNLPDPRGKKYFHFWKGKYLLLFHENSRTHTPAKTSHYECPQSTLIPAKAFNQCEFHFMRHTNTKHTKNNVERPGKWKKKIPILWWKFAVDIRNWNILLVPLIPWKMQRAVSTRWHKNGDGTNPNNHKIIKTRELRAEERWREKWLNRSTFIFVYYRLHILQAGQRRERRESETEWESVTC